MFWIFYEILFWIALVLASPYYLLRMRKRGGYAADFLERFGILNPSKQEKLKNSRPIWIHAVSVGEITLALQLIRRLQESPSSPPILLSTTTSTGHGMAMPHINSRITLIYAPLDSRFCFRKIHALCQPRAFILIEAELWPHHLDYCARHQVPLMLINARLSKRNYPRYRTFQQLFHRAFQAMQLVTLQTEEDRQRLLHLGFHPRGLRVIGSLKYDTSPADDKIRNRLYSHVVHLKNQTLWVAGSTHPGEEALILDIFLRLKNRHPGLKLALAPRHAERADDIEQLLKNSHISYFRRSRLDGSPHPDFNILLLDTTGELRYLYEMATVIFMGKSLVGHGGQNIIEPAACGRPLLFGPHMENFEMIASDFIQKQAAIQIASAEQLEKEVSRLLDDPDEACSLGVRARKWVASQQGNLARTVESIQSTLPF